MARQSWTRGPRSACPTGSPAGGAPDRHHRRRQPEHADEPEPVDELDVAPATCPSTSTVRSMIMPVVVVRERRCRHHRAQEQVVVLEPPVPHLRAGRGAVISPRSHARCEGPTSSSRPALGQARRHRPHDHASGTARPAPRTPPAVRSSSTRMPASASGRRRARSIVGVLRVDRARRLVEPHTHAKSARACASLGGELESPRRRRAPARARPAPTATGRGRRPRARSGRTR